MVRTLRLALHDGVDHAVVLEEDDEILVFPTRDWRFANRRLDRRPGCHTSTRRWPGSCRESGVHRLDAADAPSISSVSALAVPIAAEHNAISEIVRNLAMSYLHVTWSRTYFRSCDYSIAARDEHMLNCGLMRPDDQSSRIIRRTALSAGKAAHPIRVLHHADIPARDRARRGRADRHPVGHERLRGRTAESPAEHVARTAPCRGSSGPILDWRVAASSVARSRAYGRCAVRADGGHDSVGSGAARRARPRCRSRL